MMEDIERIREKLLKELEEGRNKTLSKNAREMVLKCVSAQYSTGFDYFIYHNGLVLESDVLHTIFNEGLNLIKSNKNVVKLESGENAGCLAVKLSDELINEFGELKNPYKILIRSDGTATYIAKDIVYHMWKFGKLKGSKKKLMFSKFMENISTPQNKPSLRTIFVSDISGKYSLFSGVDKIVNIIGVEQKYPQRIVMDILKNLGYLDDLTNYVHVSYGHVRLETERFSGRKGTWKGYSADKLLSEAKSKVSAKMNHGLPNEEAEKIVQNISVAAIKFFFLKNSNERNLVFKWDEVLKMEGDSGPYVLYAYVRSKSILRKSNEKTLDDWLKTFNPAQIELNHSEKEIIKLMGKFNEIVVSSADTYSPSKIARYCVSLSSAFTDFYMHSPVMNAETKDIFKMRIAITKAVSETLSKGLYLLGVNTVEKM